VGTAGADHRGDQDSASVVALRSSDSAGAVAIPLASPRSVDVTVGFQ
jgi:hypothetical protein